jgi:hypothetical protein
VKVQTPNSDSSLKRIAIVVLTGALACWVTWNQILRLDLGVNTLDESYYAFHLHQFRTLGYAGSFDRTIHQFTSAFVSPFANLFWRIAQSQDGTIIFLRSIYLIMTVVGSVILAALIRRTLPIELVNRRSISVISVLIYLGFVPFGVQAISYNTLPIFLSICLLAQVTKENPSRISACIAGVAASMLIIVSPQSAPVVFGLVAFLFVAAWKRTRQRATLLLLVFSFCVPILVLIVVFGVSKVLLVYQFQSSYSSFGGIWYRLRPAANLLVDNATYATMVFFIALHRGIPRVRNSVYSVVIMLVSVVAIWRMETHFLFVNHDVVLALAAASFWRICSPTCWREERKKSLIVAYSAGLAVCFGMATQNNPFFNASGGLVLAACITISDLLAVQWRWKTFPRCVLAVGIVAICTSASSQAIAAADAQDGYSWEVKDGWFSGLRTTPAYEQLQSKLLNVVNHYVDGDRRAAYFGDHFGFLLDVNFVSLNPQSYPILRGNRYQNATSDQAILAGTQFYSRPDQQPSTVFVENGALIPIGLQFFCLYSLEAEESLGNDFIVRVYQRDNSISVCPA